MNSCPKPPPTPRPVYVVELTTEPGFTAPPDVRLRRALKLLLRSFGLRCVGVRETPRETAVPAEQPQAAAVEPGP